MEKEMATHSSVLAWRIPGMAEPGGLPSMGSHRVGHDWSNLAADFLKPRTRNKWLNTHVLVWMCIVTYKIQQNSIYVYYAMFSDWLFFFLMYF